jgi:hypothetical protein
VEPEGVAWVSTMLQPALLLGVDEPVGTASEVGVTVRWPTVEAQPEITMAPAAQAVRRRIRQLVLLSNRLTELIK